MPMQSVHSGDTSRVWSVRPTEGVGQLALGMKRDQVRATFALPPAQDLRRRWGIASEVDSYLGETVLVYFDADHRARIIEICRPLQAKLSNASLIGSTRQQLELVAKKQGWALSKFADDKRRAILLAEGLWFTFLGGTLATVSVAQPELLEPLRLGCRPWRC